MTGTAIRRYEACDEPSWLRCRVLAFLGTAYFDDVLTAKPAYADAVELVAVEGNCVVGVLDVSIAAESATIETIAVDPDHARRGIGAALLTEARRHLPPTVTSLDAWTRDDEAANGWYVAQGFVETFRYLHVYASSDEETAAAISATTSGMALVKGFFHARIEEEAAMRASYSRVYVCRRYVLGL